MDRLVMINIPYINAQWQKKKTSLCVLLVGKGMIFGPSVYVVTTIDWKIPFCFISAYISALSYDRGQSGYKK